MTAERTKLETSRLILAGCAAWALGGGAFAILYVWMVDAVAVWTARPAPWWCQSLLAAVTGAVVGSMQWLTLRRHQIRFQPWLLASIAGAVLGQFLGKQVVASLDTAWPGWPGAYSNSIWLPGDLFWLTAAVVAGALAGTAQWLVLRQQLTWAGWWILATTLGCAIGFSPIFTFLSNIPFGPR